MKADINENGRITIQSETPLEAYALRKWCEENMFDEEPNTIKSNNIIFIADTKSESVNGN